MNARNLILSERQLVECCIQGQKDMQEHLYTKYKSKMFSVCQLYASNRSDAEDMLQEGFLRVFANLSQFRFEGSFEGWMRRIFVATSIDALRKKKMRKSLPLLEVQVSDYHLDGFERLHLSDMIRLIQSLPDKYRIVFNLFEMEGYSHKEISEFLEIPEGTSKSQLARAKDKLKKSMGLLQE